MKKSKPANRVVCGGSWGIVPGCCRSSCHCGDNPEYCDYNFGFRVVRGPRTPPVKKGDKGDGK